MSQLEKPSDQEFELAFVIATALTGANRDADYDRLKRLVTCLETSLGLAIAMTAGPDEDDIEQLLTLTKADLAESTRDAVRDMKAAAQQGN